MQKINILNFDQITSHADRQPAQFAQLAPERAGLQGEHHFHELDARSAPEASRQRFGFCEQIRANMSRTAARAYVCSRLCSSRIPKAAKQPKQHDTSEKRFFDWSNGFSMILLAHVVLKPTNLNTFPLLSLRFSTFLKS